MNKIKNVFINERPIEKLSEYISLVESVCQSFKAKQLWFRGNSKSNYKLLPSIYREKYLPYSFKKETDIFKDFRRLSKLSSFTDKEIYLMMQHFKTPTRLLDWTESSLVGLFFALNSEEKCENPVVWILDPIVFNLELNQNGGIPFFGKMTHQKVLHFFDTESMDYLKMPDRPFAILSDHIDQRIINQKGCFVIFGKEQISLEDLSEKTNRPFLAKIEINNGFIEKINEELLLTGIDYYSIYPDLEGLSKKIVYDYYRFPKS